MYIIFISFSWSFLGWPPSCPTSPTQSKQAGIHWPLPQRRQQLGVRSVEDPVAGRLFPLPGRPDRCPLQGKQKPLLIPRAAVFLMYLLLRVSALLCWGHVLC